MGRWADIGLTGSASHWALKLESRHDEMDKMGEALMRIEGSAVSIYALRVA